MESYSRQAECMDSVLVIVDMNVSGKCFLGDSVCMFILMQAKVTNRVISCLDSCIIDVGETITVSI